MSENENGSQQPRNNIRYFLDPDPQKPQELDEIEYDTIPGIVNS